MISNRLPKLREAQRGSVVDPPSGQGLMTRLDNRIRGHKIGFTDFHMDYGSPLGLQVRKGHAGIPLFTGWQDRDGRYE